MLVGVGREEGFGGAGEHGGARVVHLVDPVAEAHQPFAAGELLAQHRLGPFGRADLEDRVERRAGRAAVQRTLERADRADQRREEVERVETITRRVKVEALALWSHTVTR